MKLVKASDSLAEKLDSLKEALVAAGEDPQASAAELSSYEKTQHQVSQTLFVYALVMNVRSDLRTGWLNGPCSMPLAASCFPVDQLPH